MDPLVHLTAAACLARRVRGALVAGARPVERSGLHLDLVDRDEGVRLDTRPQGGAALVEHRAPARLQGGRSAWPELAGIAARTLADRRIAAVRVTLAPRAVLIGLTNDAVQDAEPTAWAILADTRAGTLLALRTHDREPVFLPRAPLVPPERLFPPIERALDALGDTAKALRRAAGACPPHDAHFAESAADASGGLFSPNALRRMSERIGGAAALVERLEDVAEALDGSGELPLRVDPSEAATATPHARWAGAIELHVDPSTPSDTCDTTALPDAAMMAWYRLARASEQLEERRATAVAALREERGRVRRALRAVERETADAPDPVDLRRRAEALLAGGASARLIEGRVWEVPDPQAPDTRLSIPLTRPNQAPHELASELFAKARKQERGLEARAERQAALVRRARSLDELAERMTDAGSPDELDALEAALRDAGLGVGLEGAQAAPPSKGAAKRERAAPARVFRSPGGLEILVGRTARQNDRITFRVASPDDLWMHVVEYGGAHVVLRLAGRRGDPPEEDVERAAELAAAFSQAPPGVRVDVHVARRKHVRKPRGAPPGAVTVKKARTVRVTVPERPPA